MNFNLFILFFALFSFSSCGVKAKPLSPPPTAIKSYIDSYTAPAPSQDKTK